MQTGTKAALGAAAFYLLFIKEWNLPRNTPTAEEKQRATTRPSPEKLHEMMFGPRSS